MTGEMDAIRKMFFMESRRMWWSSKKRKPVS